MGRSRTHLQRAAGTRRACRVRLCVKRARSSSGGGGGGGGGGGPSPVAAAAAAAAGARPLLGVWLNCRRGLHPAPAPPMPASLLPAARSRLPLPLPLPEAGESQPAGRDGRVEEDPRTAGRRRKAGAGGGWSGWRLPGAVAVARPRAKRRAVGGSSDTHTHRQRVRWGEIQGCD